MQILQTSNFEITEAVIVNKGVIRISLEIL